MLGLLLGEVNWTNISANWPGWIISAYETIFSNWTYPLIFLGVIGYVYCVSRSAMTAAAVVCLIFGIYGGTAIFSYPETSQFSMLGWVIAVTAFAGLFTTLFISRHRQNV